MINTKCSSHRITLHRTCKIKTIIKSTTYADNNTVDIKKNILDVLFHHKSFSNLIIHTTRVEICNCLRKINQI